MLLCVTFWKSEAERRPSSDLRLPRVVQRRAPRSAERQAGSTAEDEAWYKRKEKCRNKIESEKRKIWKVFFTQSVKEELSKWFQGLLRVQGPRISGLRDGSAHLRNNALTYFRPSMARPVTLQELSLNSF